MSLFSDVEDIGKALKAGKYQNEAAVSQGIILRLLNSLGWSIFDSNQVSPEFSVGAGRADYALCNLHGKPVILIESKYVGNAQGSERQLFEYAFHQGIPMAVLTDGQEWSFFLPGEQGSYHERCVYKLDLLVRTTEESCRIFERYLKYTEVVSGSSVTNARTDYSNVSKQRQIKATLPQAWAQLLQEQDEILVELVADKVESLCGFKPDPDVVRIFFNSLLQSPVQIPIMIPKETSFLRNSLAYKDPTPLISQNGDSDFSGFTYRGQKYHEVTAIDTLFRVFEILSSHDTNFFERYAALPRHGKKRRYIARSKIDLYPGRIDLCEKYSQQKFAGWWIGTNYSRSTIRHAIELACDVAGVKFGHDLKLI